MSAGHSTSTVEDGIALLERAVSYLLGSLRLVRPEDLSRPTPCREWDLTLLLVHLNDSLAALEEAGDLGSVGLAPSADGPGSALDLAAELRTKACGILGAWTNRDSLDVAVVGGCPVSTTLVTATGALEVAVHGWDISQACGESRPIPTQLAEDLLVRTPLLVSAADRPARFARPVPVAPAAPVSARLLAFLGRP